MGRKNSKKKKETHKRRTSPDKLVKGVLEITRSGMGFVSIPDLKSDVLIKPSDLNTALNGDKVTVLIKDTAGRGNRIQGVVKEVLQRKRLEFMGDYKLIKDLHFLLLKETSRCRMFLYRSQTSKARRNPTG